MIRILLLSRLVTLVVSSNLCIMDEDCSNLGELKCMKTSCNWGSCGCPHGTVSRYLGSFRNYKCVPLRNVGESCSTEDDSGVCGPDDSFCNQTTSKCECDLGFYAASGGETCVRSPQIGETQLNSLGSCSINTPYTPLSTMIPTCRCPQRNYRIDYSRNVASNFVSRITPQCVPNGVGGVCLTDADCFDLPTMECVNNVCSCRSALVVNYEGTSCKRALPIDAKCSPAANEHVADDLVASDYECDGEKGLKCGDACNLDLANNASTWTCTCGPWHTRSGNQCVAIGQDGACFGDFNCMGWKSTAVCVNSVCVEGGSSILTSNLISTILPLVVLLFIIQPK